MVEKQPGFRIEPKPSAAETQRILNERAGMTPPDPDFRERLCVLAEEAGNQLQAHLAHGTQNDPGSNFDALHKITQEWERLNGNITLDQKE